MHFTAVSSHEGNWTDGALVKDFTVFLLNVGLLSLKGLENHITVKTPGRKGNNATLYSSFCKAYIVCLLSYLLVPSLASVVQTVFLDMLLYVRGATQGTTLRTAVRGLVCVDAFMSSKAAFVG